MVNLIAQASCGFMAFSCHDGHVKDDVDERAKIRAISEPDHGAEQLKIDEEKG